MNNLSRLKLELNEKEYFQNNDEVLIAILEENGLDAFEQYEKANDRVEMLESVYAIMQMLSNDIDKFRKVETEFASTSAASQQLTRRMSDIRNEIDRVKRELYNSGDSEDDGKVISYLFFNGRE